MRIKDFQGFRFGKIHTSDLNLEVVSTSNRYEPRILPAPTDTVADIPGSDGQYYFGSVYKNREIICELAFDNVSEQIYRKIRQLFSTDKLQDLVFDEEPYKTWKAKIKAKPEFKSLCFTDKESGQRVYKGTGKLNFICYYPYAFGFNKYIVRAADYYLLNPPECIINESYSDNTFVKNNKNKNYGRVLPEDIKYHYNLNPSDYDGGANSFSIAMEAYRDKSHRNKGDRNWEPNDKLVWKSGFPTSEQVEAGELFFDTDQGEKTIIEVKNYWDNVPEWQGTAKLLTTPTLDYEQELMYLPQYSKTDFINMEMGFDKRRTMIGSRILVYNPGDLPVDWEIRFDENKRSFWSSRGGTRFRVSRFNVERLSIPNAVDWCGLKTYEVKDDDPFKYGNKYFKRRVFDKTKIINAIEDINEFTPTIWKSQEDYGYSVPKYTKDEIIYNLRLGKMVADKNWGEEKNYAYWSKTLYPDTSNIKGLDYNHFNDNKEDAHRAAINLHLNDFWKPLLSDWRTLKGLGKAHPHHCYYVEPIPRQKLGHYIKLFYWQTIQWRGDWNEAGQLIGNEKWKDMLSESLTINENNEYYIDINNPLVDFLKMFANIQESDGKITASSDETFRKIYRELDYEEGIAFANKYEELLSECMNEEEEYELYWDTLKKLLRKYIPMFEHMKIEDPELRTKGFNVSEEIQKFIDSFINHPIEYINSDLRDLNYKDDVFNGYKMPQWMTDDYMEIDQHALSGVETIEEFLEAIGEDPDGIFTGKRVQYTQEKRQELLDSGNYSKLIRTLDKTIGVGGYINDLLDDYYYLNTDKRMLYTTTNPYGMEFVYKPNKTIMNEAVVRGKWFKIPPGWSLITVEPLVDETLWGGKRWEDARPYDWGYGGDLNRNKREVQQLYEFVYELAKDEFFTIYPKDIISEKIVSSENLLNYDASIEDDDLEDGYEQSREELLKFKIWYEVRLNFWKNKHNYFATSLFEKYRNDGEYTLLNIINEIWTLIAPYFSWTSQKGVYLNPDIFNVEYAKPTLDDYDVTGYPLRCINGDISDWWWYASNYLWANFPPLYWAMADMLNKIKIKYTPLFY